MRHRCHGELAKHEKGVQAARVEHGYTERSIANQLRVLADLARWLELHGLVPAQLDATRVDDYLAFRREQGHRLYRSARGLSLLLMHLRDQGVIPLSAEAADSRPFAAVLAQFRRYLLE